MKCGLRAGGKRAGIAAFAERETLRKGLNSVRSPKFAQGVHRKVRRASQIAEVRLQM